LDPLRAILDEADGAGQAFVRSASAEQAMQSSRWQAQLQYSVNVTNTGHVDADDVVLGFLTPPGAGQNGVPLKSLFGFERVHVKAGATVTVFLYPSILDFAQVSLDGQLQVFPGEYKVHFGVAETQSHGMGYVEAGSLLADHPTYMI